MNSTLLKDLNFNDRRQKNVLREIKSEKPLLIKKSSLFRTKTWRFALSTVFTTSLLLILSLFVADQLEQADKSDRNTAKTVVNNKSNVIESIKDESKVWRDLSSAGDLKNPDFATNVREWVPQTLERLEQPVPSRYPGAGMDEGYDIYLKAEMLRDMLGPHIRVEGEDLNKDFQNIQTLISYIGHHQYVRTAHIDSYGNAKEKTEYMDEWKPADDTLFQAFENIKHLLHDIDVAINKDGRGKTYGVSHQLDGEKVKEFERFMYGSNKVEQ